MNEKLRRLTPVRRNFWARVQELSSVEVCNSTHMGIKESAFLLEEGGAPSDESAVYLAGIILYAVEWGTC